MIDDRKTVRPDQEAQARDRQAREEAAGWYARLNVRRVSNADLAEFYAWRADSLNDAAYTRVEETGGRLRAVADHPAIQAMADAALSRPRPLHVRAKHLFARFWPPIVGVGVLAAAALVAAFAFGGLGQQTYRTEVGERRVVKLDDGSTLELNTDSQVRVRLSKARRDLTLDRGQALFVVAHDAGRPFVVQAGDTAVRAIGTRFEVYRGAAGVKVTLAEGRVQVSKVGTSGPAAAPVTLAAGEQLSVGPKAARPVRIDVAAATGWTDGRLTFKDARLADAVAEVNRYSKSKVVLGPDVAPDQRLNGVFDAGDTEAFVAGVTTVLDLASAQRPDGSIALTRAPGAPT